MDSLTISLIQTDIVWENKAANLRNIEEKIASLHNSTDIVVLPEMFTTGFSMRSSEFAEENSGETVRTLKRWASHFGFAIAGSFIACDQDGKRYNRGFFITPEEMHFYDKRHLFRMSDEPNHFTAGNTPLIVNYRNWNISLQICYDLRFPVWCRNKENEYDLQLFVASWPEPRQRVWDILLKARAIENCAYVAGVNRVGEDNNGLNYLGGSVVIDMKGNILTGCEPGSETILTTTLSKEKLLLFREKFPAWKDADSFTINNLK